MKLSMSYINIICPWQSNVMYKGTRACTYPITTGNVQTIAYESVIRHSDVSEVESFGLSQLRCVVQLTDLFSIGAVIYYFRPSCLLLTAGEV